MYVGIGSVVLVSYILSGIYIVNWDEVGIVRRFGTVVQENVTPGLHYRFPAPVDQITLIKKDKIQNIETGQQELLTGDTNLLNVNMSVHYKVRNVAEYVLNINDLETLISSSATTSIRELVGENNTDYLLTEGKSEIEQQAKVLLQDAMDRNLSGVQIIGVQLLDVSPPENVLASFQDLASARQDKVIYVNEAMQYNNAIIPQANADAYRLISEAEAYKNQKVKTAEGDATLFEEKWKAYSSYAAVTRFRFYMETMDQILPNVKKIMLGANVKIDNAELWIANDKTGGNN
jgi:membrane protease subunit HflK